MKLSFVIPAYNEEAVLPKCLESIYKEINANKYDTEVIVVNNASTDRTREIALSYGARVVDEPIKGLVSARKAGFEESTGELVANIDSDVILPQGWLKFVMESFERDSELVALSGPFIYYDLSAFTRALVKVFYALGYLTHLLNEYILHVSAMLQGGNFVIKREAMVKAGGFDTTIAFYGEDTDVAKRLSKVGKVRWTFKLPVLTSGRRLKQEGVVIMSLRYSVNYFWITWFNRPFSQKYKDIRPSADTVGGKVEV
jgi:glycosyltransferase involved in cell wall biosynthesis